jgi:phage-related protein
MSQDRPTHATGAEAIPGAAPDFRHVPSYSTKSSVEPRISKVEFGDGYAQRMGRGINTMMEAVSVAFDHITDAEAEKILAFFAARGGTEPFTARINPGSPIKRYVTEGGWDRTWDAWSDNTVTATFREVP